MNLDLPDVAADFGASAGRAFADSGGVDLARRAEVDPSLRASVVAPLLSELGAFDLSIGADPDTNLAAGELCRAAGQVALPYPLAATLASELGAERPVAVVDPSLPRADHADLFRHWRVATIDGSSWHAEPSGAVQGTRLGPFVGALATRRASGPADVRGCLALGGWVLLGVVEQALALTVEHVTSRHQFGKPLSSFQSVQFQVADAAVSVQSLRELARFTMWRISVVGADGLVDALALRVLALETGTQVLRTCQQLHGAIGLTQEHDLSILTRHAQPLLRMPFGLEATTEHLMRAVDAHGFESLFQSNGRAPSPGPA